MENSQLRARTIESLRQDIGLHEKSAFSDLGADFDKLDADRWSSPDVDLMLAWNFWEAWIDEARHNFAGFYKGINKSETIFSPAGVIGTNESR